MGDSQTLVMKKRRSNSVPSSGDQRSSKPATPRSTKTKAAQPVTISSSDRAATERALAGFEKWLESGFGPTYQRELIGDLTDLRFTLRQTESRLRSMLASVPASRKAADLELFHLRIEITDELPPIFRDIKKSIDALIGAFD